jgi:hypothetical protein
MNIFTQITGIIVIIIIIWIYWIYLNHPTFNNITYEELKPRFKTGDIILFHALDNINPIFIGSYFGHIGIVYVDPDDPNKIPYLFEAAGTKKMCLGKHNNPRGIFFSKLDDRLRRYKGYTFYKELSHPIDPAICRGFKNFINFAYINMYYEYNVVSSGIKKGTIEKCSLNTNCGEIVFLSLIKLGMLSKSDYYNNTFHYLLKTAHIKDLLNGYYYNEPLYIKYHPF